MELAQENKMSISWRNQHVRLPEEDWAPRTLEDLIDLRNMVIAADVSPRTADRLIAWVLTKSAGEPDETSSNTRSNYRKILETLPGPGPNAPDRMNQGNERSDRGVSNLAVVGMASLAASTLAFSNSATGLVTSALLTPIMHVLLS